MTTMEKIVHDSEFFSNLLLFGESDGNNSINNYFMYTPLVKNKKNIIKLYEGSYDFSNEELFDLMHDLHFLNSKKIFELFIIMKSRDFNRMNDEYSLTYFKDKINEELNNAFVEYNSIKGDVNIFTSLVSYNCVDALEYFYDERYLYAAASEAILKDNLRSFIFLMEKGFDPNENFQSFIDLVLCQHGNKIIDYLGKTEGRNPFFTKEQLHFIREQAKEAKNFEIVSSVEKFV